MTQRRMELIDLKGIILSFRITDLQALLANFGCNHIGRKNELQNRALELLFNPPPTLNTEKYKQKIRELFRDDQQQTQIHQNPVTNRSIPAQQPSYGVPPIQFPPPTPVRSNLTGANVVYQNVGNYAYPKMYVPVQDVVECNLSNVVQFKQRTSPSNVQFRPLPFYNVKQEVLRPSVLISNSPTTLRVNGRVNNTHEFTLSFVLTCDVASEIAMNRDLVNKKFMVQLQLRMCAVDSSISLVSGGELDDFLPLGLVVRVNGIQCTSLPPLSPSSRPNQDVRRIPGPVDLSALLKLSPKNANTLTINWIPEISKTFSICINLVEKLSSDFLLDKLKERPSLSIDFTKLMIRKQYRRVIDDDDDTSAVDNDDDDDIATTIVRVSLMCPLAKFRMIHPAKGKNCSHLQCFDGSAFISLNEKKSMWICPVCHKRLSFDDLLIDQYFVDVLSNRELSEDCQEVQLLVDGSWKSYFEEIPSDGNNEKQSANPPKNSPPNVPISDKESVTDVKSTTDNVGNMPNIVTNGADTVVDLISEDEEIPSDHENSPSIQLNNPSASQSPVQSVTTPSQTDLNSNQETSELSPRSTEPESDNKDEENESSVMETEDISPTPPANSENEPAEINANQNVISLDSPLDSSSPLHTCSLNELNIDE